jgi:uncharacterized protein (TIGR03437 family)
MRSLRLLSGLGIAACCLAQTIDVGTGAPNEAIRDRFIKAFNRNRFYMLVVLPPLTPVQPFGGTGLIQIFRGVGSSTERLAIIKPNTSTAYPPPQGEDGTIPIDTFQVLAPMYAYYTSEQLGPGVVGFPTMDTSICSSATLGACQYQIFDKNYALFVYPGAPTGQQNFLLRDPLFTQWKNLGGIATLGPAVSNEASVTSSAGTTGSFQSFANGALVRITSGLYGGRTFSVQQPVWELYSSYNTYAGVLGFPISDELLLPDGRRRQTFEGGSVEYAPGAGATLRLPVASIAIQPSTSPLRMNLGDTLTLRAILYAANGAELTDRQVNWTTSNSRIVSLETSGASVTLKAVGGGVATVQATSEGKTSLPITVVVAAPCCQIGEGAPTAAIQQAFEDAVTRNRLSLRLPTPNAVRRAGNGYVQEFTDASGARVVLAKPDRVPAAFVLTGAILARWEELGGPTGSLGYPISDATPGGRQLFENDAALAGTPVRIVAGAILAKWAALGYETGVAGPPLEEASPFLTFTGTAGISQTFLGGAIYAARTGARAGQAFFVRGPILAKYLALEGAGGVLGMPLGDEFTIEGRVRQTFEGGELEYGPGDSEARATLKPRQLMVTTTPSVVTPGNRVRIVVGGFAPGATVRVSVTERPDFEVRTQTGAYTWEQYVPPNAASRRIVIRATSGTETAEGSYQIRALTEQRVQLSKLSGDAQTGLPGALLPQPLRIVVKDESGNPVPGVTVRFTASPGAQVTSSSATTDAEGRAETRVRLPAQEGVALVTASALGQVVTFSARSAAGGLGNFPRFLQSGSTRLGPGPATIGDKGALLVAAASILRYYQNLGALPATNGLADPLLLNDFLGSFCALDAEGNRICDGYLTGFGDPVVNLWRLAEFVNGNLEVVPERADPGGIRDLLAEGSPVLVALALESEGAGLGAHFVVATGVRSDGAVVIHDPNPALGRSVLEDYLAGFPIAGRMVKGRIASALRLLPRSAPAGGFLVISPDGNVEISSIAGACGQSVEWPAGVATSALEQISSGMFRSRYCEGSRPPFQLDVGAEGDWRLIVTDLVPLGSRFELSGKGAATFGVSRPAGRLVLGPQTAAILPSGVVNSASFTPALAPGGLMTVFGSGLARAGAATEVEIGGVRAHLIAATPFQLNVEIPAELPPGSHLLRIRSPFGTAEQTITLDAVAPAIFTLPTGGAAVVNQNGSLNGSSNPERRGRAIVIYCTGLGAVAPSGSLSTVREPVKVGVDGVELEPFFAGTTQGYRGLYQVNVLLPASLPPRLDAVLKLRQGAAWSNSVSLAID